MMVEIGAAALGVRFRVAPRDVEAVLTVAAVAVDVSEAALRAF